MSDVTHPALPGNINPPPPPPPPLVTYDDARCLVTIITNDQKGVDGQLKPFGKVAWIDDGLFKTETHASVYSGDFETIATPTLENLVWHLTKGYRNSSSALVYGIHPGLRGKIGTRKNGGGIARTNENFPRRKGRPGVLNFDLDDQPDRGIRVPDVATLDALLCARVSWWSGVRRAYLPSTSAGIYMPDGSPASHKRGQRCLMLIDDSSRAKDAGRQVVAALYEAGYGKVIVNVGTKSVSRLWRSPGDETVWDDSKPDFGFGAKLYGGLRQVREPISFDGAQMLRTADVPVCDHLAAFKTSPAGRQMWAAVEAEFQAAQAKVRGGFVAAEVTRLGITPQKAERLFDLANADMPELADDWVIHLDANTTASSAEIQANPEKYDGLGCCDPVEPEYDNWRKVAKIYAGKGQKRRIVINSWAHGGDGKDGPKTYLLRPYTLTEMANRAFGGPATMPLPGGGVPVPPPPPPPQLGGGEPVPLPPVDPMAAYQAAKQAVLASPRGEAGFGTADIRPLITLLAAATDDALTVAEEIKTLSDWGNNKRTGPVMKAYKAERAKIARQQHSAQRAAAQQADTGDWSISPEMDYPVALARALKRFCVLSGGNRGGAVVADLSCIGERGWQTSMASFTQAYGNIYRIEARENGGVRITLPTDFAADPQRLTARHTQFDPKQGPGLIPTGNGDRFINTYRPPMHVAPTGNTGVFHQYLHHLIPNNDERVWFYTFLAHKVLKPSMRAPVCVFVNNNEFGSGRGILRQVITLLFQHHVTEKMAAEFAGIGTPGQWTDWQENSLWVFVDEMKGGDLRSSYFDGQAVYETIKRICDTSPGEKGITKRATESYHADLYFSTIISSNHLVPFHVEHGCRRTWFTENCKRIPDDLRRAMVGLNDGAGWIDDPANISALWHELRAHAMASRFDPFAEPPMTAAKQRAIASSHNAVDDAVREFRALIKEHQVELVTKTIVVEWLTREICEVEDAHRGSSMMQQQERAIMAVAAKLVQSLPSSVSKTGSGSSNGQVRVGVLANYDRWKNSTNAERMIALEHARKILGSPSSAPKLTIISGGLTTMPSLGTPQNPSVPRNM